MKTEKGQVVASAAKSSPAMTALRVHAHHTKRCPCETPCSSCGDILWYHEFGACQQQGCKCESFRP